MPAYCQLDDRFNTLRDDRGLRGPHSILHERVSADIRCSKTTMYGLSVIAVTCVFMISIAGLRAWCGSSSVPLRGADQTFERRLVIDPWFWRDKPSLEETVCNAAKSTPSLKPRDVWILDSDAQRDCYENVRHILAQKGATLGGIDNETSRNWCWVGLKEFGCHSDFSKWPRPRNNWDEMRQGAVAEMGTYNAFPNPLLHEEVCDRKEMGASKTWSEDEWHEAWQWFTKHVAVYVLNMQADVARWDVIRKHLGDIDITAKRVFGVDMRPSGALQKAKVEGLIPDQFSFNEAQAEAFSVYQGKGSILGTVGCAAAHFRAQTEALKNSAGKPLALILEDDAVLEHDIVPRLWNLLRKEIPCDWQVLSLRSMCPHGTCVSQHLTRVQPDVNEPADRCHHGVNYGFQGVLYRLEELQKIQHKWKSTVFNESRPHCLDVDVALASISDSVGFYAIPFVQAPGFLSESHFKSSRESIGDTDIFAEPVFRFWDKKESERNFHLLPAWDNEEEGAIEFYAFRTQKDGTEPIYDFWDDPRKEHTFHFPPAWKDETIGHVQFYAFRKEVSGTEPVYDFSTANKTHTFHFLPARHGETRGNIQFYAQRFQDPLHPPPPTTTETTTVTCTTTTLTRTSSSSTTSSTTSTTATQTTTPTSTTTSSRTATATTTTTSTTHVNASIVLAAASDRSISTSEPTSTATTTTRTSTTRTTSTAMAVITAMPTATATTTTTTTITFTSRPWSTLAIMPNADGDALFTIDFKRGTLNVSYPYGMLLCFAPVVVTLLICAYRNWPATNVEKPKHWDSYTALGALNIAAPMGASTEDPSYASDNSARPFLSSSYMTLPWGPRPKMRPAGERRVNGSERSIEREITPPTTISPRNSRAGPSVLDAVSLAEMRSPRQPEPEGRARQLFTPRNNTPMVLDAVSLAEMRSPRQPEPEGQARQLFTPRNNTPMAEVPAGHRSPHAQKLRYLVSL